jgi:hypothetical protein
MDYREQSLFCKIQSVWKLSLTLSKWGFNIEEEFDTFDYLSKMFHILLHLFHVNLIFANFPRLRKADSIGSCVNITKRSFMASNSNHRSVSFIIISSVYQVISYKYCHEEIQ